MTALPRVVVTGLGPICAAGTGREALWKSLEAGKAPAANRPGEVAGRRWSEYPLHLPPAGVPPPEEGLPDDAELRLALAASRLAWGDAALPSDALREAALVLTYEAPGIDRLLLEVFQSFLDGRSTPAGRPISEEMASELLEAIYHRHKEAVYHTHSFIHLHLAARALGIHGPTLFLNNACASGLYALEAAADQLRLGRARHAIVAAAEYPRLPTKYLWFKEVNVYSPTGRLRPFDRDRDGLVLGGGAAALVLETWESARLRGAKIYAEYLGGASSQEAWKVSVPNLTEPHYERTLRAALRAAGVAPGEVDLLNPHGAGTALGDLAEAMGITAVFGEWPERPLVTALKPYFGHTLGASALLEAAAILLAMELGAAPATPGFGTPDPELKLRCLTEPARAPLRTAVKMSCGFAGFTAGAVFRAL